MVNLVDMIRQASVRDGQLTIVLEMNASASLASGSPDLEDIPPVVLYVAYEEAIRKVHGELYGEIAVELEKLAHASLACEASDVVEVVNAGIGAILRRIDGYKGIVP